MGAVWIQLLAVHSVVASHLCIWNDGMNNVGMHGKGESGWLVFFLYDVLTRFAETAARFGDGEFVDKCRSDAAVTAWAFRILAANFCALALESSCKIELPSIRNAPNGDKAHTVR